MRKPDLSKLARSTEDALTDAGLIADDAIRLSTRDSQQYSRTKIAEALEASPVYQST
jgi:Holliday junction resolvase RusA-like endonuclease